ncbi:four helix bundle protein [Desulfovulcanus sp.]
MAEGAARSSDREFIQFLYIALGSCAEVETQLIIGKELDFVEDVSTQLKILIDIRKMIVGLISYLKKKL